MDQEGVPAAADSGDDVARLVALTERQHDLWALLRDATDETTRNRLFDELAANRGELAKLKEKVTAEVDPGRVAKTSAAADPDPPRSVGEQLRAQILTPDNVAPAIPPPPPPPTVPPPAVGPSTDRQADAIPIAEADSSDAEPDRATPAPRDTGDSDKVARSDEPEPSDRPVSPDQVEQPLVLPGGLAPETTPFSSREADLAAMRAHRKATSGRQPEVRAGAVPAPEPEPVSETAPDPAPTPTTEHETVAPPEEPSTASGRRAREEERLANAHVTFQDLAKVRPKRSRSFPVIAVAVAVLAVAAVAWVLFFWSGNDSSTEEPATTTTVAGALDVSPTGQIRAVLDDLGLTTIAVEERSGTIFLVGIVAGESDRAAAIGAATALAGGGPLDTSGIAIAAGADEVRLAALQAIGAAGYDRINVTVAGGVATLTGVTPEEGVAGLIEAVEEVSGIDQVVDMTEAVDRAEALDSELQRITSVTPLIFASGQTDLTALQERILDGVVAAIDAYPGPVVTVVGHTDSAGSEQGNLQVSLVRAENVTEYLAGQGVDPARLVVEARGEATSSGSSEVAGLERRVEFEVGYLVAGGAAAGFRIGIVAPSARDDLAFTQSIVDAVNVIAGERSGIEIDITDNAFVTEEAAEAIRNYAADGYDLVLAHGSQYGTSLVDIGAEFPGTAFAWGTASETFGLPNVSSYAVASDEGGYVLGVIAAQLSESGIIGVVGPLEVGDAQLFVDGFRNGVLTTNPGADVPVTYTGSFSDVALATEAATAHVEQGADILTGTAQMVVGAVGVAAENDALWFGTQSNQAPLAEDLVVASQVYHWEVVLRQIISGIDGGDLGGEIYTIDLANGGIIIEYNEAFDLPDPILDTADETIAGIISGTILTGV